MSEGIELIHSKSERAILLQAISSAQDNYRTLLDILKGYKRDNDFLRHQAEIFLEYPGPDEIEGPIPVKLHFLDFQDDEAIGKLLSKFKDYSDLLEVVSIEKSLNDSITANHYVIIQPAMSLSPVGTYSICEEISSRVHDILKDISVGYKVDLAIAGDEPGHQKDSARVAFPVVSHDYTFRAKGNTLTVYSILRDIAKDAAFVKKISTAFPEYHLIVKGWDT